MVDLGDGGGISVMMEGPFGGSGESVKITEIFLPKDNWKGAESPYSMIVSPNGISKNSKIDIWPSKEQIALLGRMHCGLCASNESGVVTVYAIGEKPTENITLQATTTYVSTSGVLYGNLVFPAVYAGSVIGLTEKCLARDGGTMNGNLDMNGYPLCGIPDPTTDSSAVGKGYLERYVESRRSEITVTLAADGWTEQTQTIAAEGVTADNTVLVTAAPGSYEACLNTGVYCSRQGGGTLTFSCIKVPESEMTFNVMIFN